MSWGASLFAEALDVRLHYVRGGEGSPLLLSHGWPQTWREWDAVAPSLIDSFDVIAVDLPGLGDSAPLAGDYRKREVARHIAALLDQLDVGPVIVVGHDMGAAIAFALAAFYPGHVGRVVVLDMLLPGFGLEQVLDLLTGQGLWHFALHQPPGIAEMLVGGRERAYLQWLFDTQAARPGLVPTEAVDAYVAAYARPASLEAGFAYYRAVLADVNDNAVFAQAKISQPVLCIAGDHGTGGWMRTSFAGACATVEAQVLDDCGHWIPEEKPMKLITLIEGMA